MGNDRSTKPGLDDEAAASQARTLVIRWWRESGDMRLRGTVRDISGARLGAFDGFDSLVALLRRHAG